MYTDAECREMFKRIKALDRYLWTFKECRDERRNLCGKLIQNVAGLIRHKIKGMRGGGCQMFDEYVSQANYHLQKYGIPGFDLDCGWAWTTYAGQIIWDSILKLDEVESLVRVPRYAQRTPYGKMILRACENRASINSGNMLEGYQYEGVNDTSGVFDSLHEEIVKEAIVGMQENHTEVLALRSKGHSQEEVGKILKSTKENIRQTEIRALDVLRGRCRAICMKRKVDMFIRDDAGTPFETTRRVKKEKENVSSKPQA